MYNTHKGPEDLKDNVEGSALSRNKYLDQGLDKEIGLLQGGLWITPFTSDFSFSTALEPP